jgi:CRP-like cAMP-binding protein
MSNPLLLKLELRDELSAAERELLLRLTSRVQDIAAGDEIARQGESLQHSSVLIEGWALRCKTLPGGRRTITSVHVPGDFVDLHTFLLSPMDHSISMLTDGKIATVQHAQLRQLTEHQPNLTRLLWRDTLVEAAIYREWLSALGRLSPMEHLAHLVCELYLRLRMVQQVSGFSFRMPLNQTSLADAMGLSVVHLNRTVQALRATGCVNWKRSELAILDWDRMVQIGHFDSTYLHLPDRMSKCDAAREAERPTEPPAARTWEKAYSRVEHKREALDGAHDTLDRSAAALQSTEES